MCVKGGKRGANANVRIDKQRGAKEENIQKSKVKERCEGGKAWEGKRDGVRNKNRREARRMIHEV